MATSALGWGLFGGLLLVLSAVLAMRRIRRSRPPGDLPAAAERRIGIYRIERELGRGAAGSVYLGRDDAGRPAAIKTLALKQEFDAEGYVEARERFFREATTARRLDHPDIVRVFDAGECGELAYLAMDYVDGHDLQAHTRPGNLLPMDEAVEIVARVAEALAHAHARGVVHRDVKPANVLIDPARHAVKVTDFGVAQVVDAGRTRTGLMLGSPSFMAPEQLTGARIDGRTDLYSAGVMLFQLLTGALPHASDSMAELMRRIANEVPPDVRTLRADVPEALAVTVARALEKDPKARHPDGMQMAAALRAAMPELRQAASDRRKSGPRPS